MIYVRGEIFTINFSFILVFTCIFISDMGIFNLFTETQAKIRFIKIIQSITPNRYIYSTIMNEICRSFDRDWGHRLIK